MLKNAPNHVQSVGRMPSTALVRSSSSYRVLWCEASLQLRALLTEACTQPVGRILLATRHAASREDHVTDCPEGSAAGPPNASARTARPQAGSAAECRALQVKEAVPQAKQAEKKITSAPEAAKTADSKVKEAVPQAKQAEKAITGAPAAAKKADSKVKEAVPQAKEAEKAITPVCPEHQHAMPITTCACMRDTSSHRAFMQVPRAGNAVRPQRSGL